MHPEDVKAEIRKRFRTVASFERSFNLPGKSVTDLLRGYKSQRVSDAIQSVISRPVSEFVQSEDSDVSENDSAAHRLNAEAR
ncbi:hypothetical protein D3876_13525 [Sphingomonas cavernae]|uniref:Uncharacterized protein n=1 Tax=Sphingomonas cavernae TaxID=2320861 RepID=A0A418WMC4_9SPHN|nr:hypothetical protein D3876_13525 [Sphingomonas cavernae]